MGFEVSKRIYEESLKLIPWGVQTGSKRPEFLFFGDGPIYVAKPRVRNCGMSMGTNT